MNYKRLTEIDQETENRKSFRESLFEGSRNNEVMGIFSERKIVVGFIGEEGISNTDRIEYSVLRSHILDGLDKDIIDLQREKGVLLNKKWYQFWK